MFRFRKYGKNFDTIRAEELQIGDCFMFNNRAITVAHSTRLDDDTVVLMQATRLGTLRSIDAATFPNEMFITIERR